VEEKKEGRSNRLLGNMLFKHLEKAKSNLEQD
jgi:hypothetical protein